MKRWAAPAALAALWLLFANLLQSLGFLIKYWAWTPRQVLYVGVHLLGLGLLALVLWIDHRGGHPLISRMRDAIKAVPMPPAAKWVVGVVLLIELAVITVGVTIYPFTDVGMFRYARHTAALPSELIQPCYYYRDLTGRPVQVDVRREHIWAMSELLGWGYNNEYTFSVAYHYKGLPATYDHLLSALNASRGVDMLWVGLHGVDYVTGHVWFDPDPVRAMAFNDTARIFYGPLYVPDHQRALIGADDQRW